MKKEVQTYRKYLIFMIIIIALILRIYFINSPIMGHHSWRQADDASMARNFYEYGGSILYPQIDWKGPLPSYIEAGFALNSYVISLFYHLFGGVYDVIGRLFSVLFSLISLYLLYLIVKWFLDEKTALFSALIFSVLPLSIFYGRAFMSESAIIMSLLFGIYFFVKWIDVEKKRYFYSSAIFILIATLMKITALHIVVPLFFLAYSKYKNKIFFNRGFWLYLLIVIIPTALYYYHAHQIFVDYGTSVGIWDFGNHTSKYLNFDKYLDLMSLAFFIIKRLILEHLAIGGFILFTIGLFVKRRSEREYFLDIWLLSVLIYFVIAFGGNLVHDYYQLYFLLPVSVYCGKAMSKYLRFDGQKVSLLLKIVVLISFITLLILGLFHYSNLIFLEDKGGSNYRLAEDIKNLTEPDSLIGVVDYTQSEILYLSDRKGWRTGSKDNSDRIDNLKLRLDYFAGEWKYFDNEADLLDVRKILDNHEVIVNNRDYFIVKLI